MMRRVKSHCDAAVRLLRVGFLFIFDTLVLPANRPQTARTEGAIFCLHGWGDLLLAGHTVTRLAAHLRARGLKAVLFVHPDHVEFARRYFDVDAVEGIDRHLLTRKFSYRAQTLRSVAGRFAVALQPTYNRMSRVEDALMRATGAKEKIGSVGHAPFILPLERKVGDPIYTRLIPAQPAAMHELLRHAEFMAGLGITLSTEPWRIRHWEPSANRSSLAGRNYLVIAANASDQRRSWSSDNFLRVARKIATQHQLAIVLIGDQRDQSPASWPEVSDSKPELIDLRGQTSTCDLVALITRAELIICNDSGVYHLGVSLNRPTLAVGGSGLPARYFPYPDESALRTKVLFHPVPCAGCNWRCLYTSSRSETAWCIQQITWPEAVAAADQLLQHRSQP